MKCPKCGGPMGNTNLQEKLCLACGYIGAPAEEAPFNPEHDNLVKELADVKALAAMYGNAEMAWERAMMAAIGEDGIVSVTIAIGKLKAKIERALIYLDADEPLSINAAKAAEILRETEAAGLRKDKP